MSTIKTIEQKRSEFAMNCVNEIIEKGQKKLRGNYRGLVKKFPMMVLKNGLLQTVVFLEAKRKEHHNFLLEHLRRYLEEGHSPLRFEIGNSMFSEFLANQKIETYRNITSDILAFSKWLGRYAEALIEEEEESE